MKNRHKYPPEWNDTIRPEILKRDNYKCSDCPVKHRDEGYYDAFGSFVICDDFMKNWAKENGKKIQRIYLQIAHLDQNKDNNSYSNLKSKCPRCHMIFDKYYNNIKRMQGRKRKAA